MYEPIWLALDDGTFVQSSLLRIDEHRERLDGEPRLFHLDCLKPADRA